jgi:ribosomal protein L22
VNKLRGVEVSTVKKILKQFPEAKYIFTYRQMTLLLVDRNKKHLGSIFLRGDIMNKGFEEYIKITGKIAHEAWMRDLKKIYPKKSDKEIEKLISTIQKGENHDLQTR